MQSAQVELEESARLTLVKICQNSKCCPELLNFFTQVELGFMGFLLKLSIPPHPPCDEWKFHSNIFFNYYIFPYVLGA